MIKRRQQTNGP